MNDRVKLLIIDDHGLVREALAKRFAADSRFEVIGVAGDAEAGVGCAARARPDVVLTDVDMPGASAFDACLRIGVMAPDVQVIFLSAFSHDRFIEQALQAGALGYVTKRESLETIVEAVYAVARGGTYFSPEVQARIVVDSTGLRLAHRGKTRSSRLSPREVEVLGHLARGMSKKAIAELMHVSIKTVDTHTLRLMGKLDIHDRVELARFAIREGMTRA
jgi:DNA-binding NarL/FixJ family response regulator